MMINDFSYPILSFFLKVTASLHHRCLPQVGAEAPRGGALGGFHRRLCSPLVTLEGKTKALRTGGMRGWQGGLDGRCW